MALTSEASDRSEIAAVAPSRRLGYRFANLWAGFSLASAGDGFAYGAVPLLALVVDPRPLAVSAVVAADGLPWLLVALPAGAFADRFPRHRVMSLANLFRALVAVMLGALVVTRSLDLVILLVAVLANAAGRAVYYSALQATVPDLVGTDALNRANGRLSGTEAAAEHLGGPVVGTAVFAIARAVPFFGEGAVFGLSTLPLLGARARSSTPPRARGGLLEGVKLLARDRRLRVLMTLVAGLAGLQGVVAGVLVLVATRDWGVHESAYGLFVATAAIGNLPGALLADRIALWFGSVRALLGAAFVAGICYLVMASAHSWLLAGVAFAVAGFAIGVGIVVSNTLRQRLAPPELMGRVGAAWRGIAWGAAPLGSLLGGGIALVGALRLPLIVAGIAQCALALVLAPMLMRALGAERRARHRKRRGADR
ncbi:MAG TPA: MFS transporter [Acidimicrobiales bacterium]|nr:MFS transporter [Acidimicrobiales bacterium]